MDQRGFSYDAASTAAPHDREVVASAAKVQAWAGLARSLDRAGRAAQVPTQREHAAA